MQAEHVKLWPAAARKSEKGRDTSGGEEAATTMEEEGRPETTSAQEGSENWMRVVDLV